MTFTFEIKNKRSSLKKILKKASNPLTLDDALDDLIKHYQSDPQPYSDRDFAVKQVLSLAKRRIRELREVTQLRVK